MVLKNALDCGQGGEPRIRDSDIVAQIVIAAFDE
jgi:hypothetical protein